MASPQIFEDLSSVFSILLQKKSEHTFLYYPLFQDYLNLLTLVFQYNLFLPHQARKDTDKEKTHAAKNEILQAEHHKVDKNE